VQFSKDLRNGVVAGEITVSFRLWKTPRVKVGGRYSVGPATIEIDALEVIPFSAVTATDLRRSGELDRRALRQRAAHSGPVHDDTLLFRVEFHTVS
jgi:hypothetical protein